MTPPSQGPAAASKPHFPGLNALRFWAAFTVVVNHALLNSKSVGLPAPLESVFLGHGGSSVDLFFVLSGFLISYLLLAEQAKTGSIHVLKFYYRRALRIWPLYFAVVTYGIILYSVVLPRLPGFSAAVNYDLRVAIPLYLVFLPHVVSSIYAVSGVLNLLWSIGVEEQFYLMWAPLAKAAGSRFFWLASAAFGGCFFIHVLNWQGVFGTGALQNVIRLSRFHCMGFGAMLGYGIFTRREWLMGLPIFSIRALQLGMYALLFEFLFIGRVVEWLPQFPEEMFRIALSGWLVLEISCNPRCLFPSFATRTFERLGELSFGMYMHHMVCVYATSVLFTRVHFWRGHPVVYAVSFFGIAVGLAIGAALVSNLVLERPFLRLKDAKFTPLTSRAQ